MLLLLYIFIMNLYNYIAHTRGYERKEQRGLRGGGEAQREGERESNQSDALCPSYVYNVHPQPQGTQLTEHGMLSVMSYLLLPEVVRALACSI